MTESPDRTLPPSLGGQEWLARRETQAVLAALTRDGHQARAVGGAVRNALMGLPVNDVDIATTAWPQDVIRFARDARLGAHPTGIDHGTVTVVASGTAFEVTTLRRDVETDGRHATVAFTDSWTEDARRRDFTLNALYCDACGRVFDPLGGYDDLRAGRVRFIDDANARIREDYLRILRFFRFTAAYGAGVPDRQGLEACIAEKKGLDGLSAERIRSELLKLLGARHASEAVSVMAEHSFLEAILGFQPDIGVLARLVAIENALSREPDAILRLAALLPDGRSGDVAALQTRLRLSGAERDRLAAAAKGVPTVRAATSEDALKIALYRLRTATFIDALLLAWARSGKTPDDGAWRARLRVASRWEPPVLPVRGTDVLSLGVPAGPDVGRILNEFEAWWIAEGFPHDRKLIEARLRTLAAGARA